MVNTSAKENVRQVNVVEVEHAAESHLRSIDLLWT